MRHCRGALPSRQEDFAVGRFRQDDLDGSRLLRPIAIPSEEHGALFAAAEIAVQLELVVQGVAFPVLPRRDGSGAAALGSIGAAYSVLRMPDQGAHVRTPR